MKGIRSRLTGPAPPVLALISLLLALGVMATTPFAWAKYVAAATVSASARVAKWDNRYTWVAGYQGAAGYLIRNGRTGFKTAIQYPKYYWENKGEVSARAIVIPCYVPQPYGAARGVANPHVLHGQYKVGEYYDHSTSDARGFKEIPPEGIPVYNYTGTGTLYYQLAWQGWSSADSSTNRGAWAWGSLASGTNITPGTGFSTPGGVVLDPSTPNGAGKLLSTFINVYSAAPAALPNQVNVTGSNSYRMGGYWRTYRIVSSLRVTQID